MLETAELGVKIPKDVYKREVEATRTSLLAAQSRLEQADLAVVVMIAGTGSCGKGEVVNLLHEWLDARGLQTHPLERPSDEERDRPPMWRYWRRLPQRGEMAIFFGGWETARAAGVPLRKLPPAELDQQLDRHVEFERMLSHENTLLVKIWLHLSKPAQRKRLKKLAADPHEDWRVTKEDWRMYKRYDDLRRVGEHLIRRTSTAEAPWHIVEATDVRYRNLTVAQRLLAALEGRMAELAAAPPRSPSAPAFLTPAPVNVINQLDLSRQMPDDDYKPQLARLQEKVARLTRRLREERHSLILVFEGNDAAGKGGAIRRVAEAIDARDSRVISVAKPTDEEAAHPYLWRFWRHLPRRGKVTIYDRSWYGRVLVERVEGFCTPREWQRAYGEMNAFEEQLTEFRTILLKFWLAISPDEQLRRFEAREATPYKQYKITPEDWRNRDRWQAYEAATCDMIERTSTDVAPWTLIEANDKNYARIQVLRTVVRALERELKD